MKLILVRHGRTALNASKCIQGQSIDSELDEQGLYEADCVATRLQSEVFHAAYSSPLLRAHKTAQKIIAYHPQISITTLSVLRERSYGLFEGKHEDFFLSDYGESGIEWEHYVPAGGESLRAVADRTLDLFVELGKRHCDETVLVVAHGAVLTSVLLRISGNEFTRDVYKQFRQGNTAVSIVHIENGIARIELLGCTKHLDE